MTFLYSIDKAVFDFFNRTLANPVTDALMPFITTERNWTLPIAVVWLGLIVFGGKKGRMTALLVAVILLVTDQAVNAVIKPLVGRERPCFVLEHVRLLIQQPHSRSFPSSHAANITAMASLFAVRYPKCSVFYILMAGLICISRITVGVHYPSDVAAGALLGFCFAAGILRIQRSLQARRGRTRPDPDGRPESKKMGRP
jgi:undecaprenyl-diphosphatase